jgi:hypothetical protein
VVSGAGQAFAVSSSGETGKQAVFLSPLERWMPTWNLDSYVLLLERAGYHVDVLLNGNVSISFLRVGLAKYDLIILRTESFSNEEVNFYCSGEPVTARARTTFANEISSRELQVGVCVGFSLIFLRNNYPANSLRSGLVYTIGSSSSELSSAFLEAGAKVFLTPEETDGYTLQWGRIDAFSIQLFKYLSKGYTVNDAIDQLKTYLHTGHGDSIDWPSLYCRGDQTFKI